MLVTHTTRIARTTSSLCIGFAASALTLSLASSAHADDAKRACVAASTDGQTFRQEDKLIEAREKFHVCANDPCPEVVKSRCTHWLSEIEAQIPSAIIRVTDVAGADVLDADVTIDGHPSKLGRPEALDPGEHVVVVTRGGQTKDQKFLLVDGERARVLDVKLPKPAPPAGVPAPPPSGAPASPSPPADADDEDHGGTVPAGAWVVGGLGLVGLGAAAYFYVQATNDFNGLQAPNSCAPRCTDAQTEPLRTHVLIADISLGVGIAAVAGATIWAIVAVVNGGKSAAPKAAVLDHVKGLDVHPVAGGAVSTFGLQF